MIFSPFVFAILAVFVSIVTANVEKAIFLGPEPVNVLNQSPSLADLHIDVLTPDNFSIRKHVDAIFPSQNLPRGLDSWLILDDLIEGQRYELRVCWMATVCVLLCWLANFRQDDQLIGKIYSQQPTAFHLTAHPLDEVFDNPELITSLHNYSMSRRQSSPSPHWDTKPAQREASIILLRLSAAADYFTLNQTLMQHPEPVLVDLILDPFLFNILPRSLVPTVGYVVLVAGVAWVLATRVVVPSLMRLVSIADEETHEDKKKQ